MGARRRPNVPAEVEELGAELTRPDLLEIAYDFALTVTRNERRVLALLLEAANARRASRKTPPLWKKQRVCGACAGRGVRQLAAGDTARTPMTCVICRGTGTMVRWGTGPEVALARAGGVDAREQRP